MATEVIPQRIDSDWDLGVSISGYLRPDGQTYAINVQLPVRTDIEKPAGSIVGAGYERVSVGEELDGVDVRLVAGEGLHRLACSDIPQLGKCITGARDEGVLVRGVQADTHDVAQMVGKLDRLGPGLNIPLHTSHVARGCENATVVDEAAARQIAGVARQLPRDTGRPITVRVEIVNGADVVETAAGDVVSARGVGAGHDP